MSIERLLQRPGIKKVIDPGTSTPLIERVKEAQNIPTKEARTATTPVRVIVQDLVTKATAVEQKAKAVIAEIKAANYSSPSFKAYYDMVEATQVTIDQVLKDPTKDLSDRNQQEIKALERDVYLNSPDPRAPFIQTLFDTLQQTGVIKSVVSQVWSSIASKTELYDQYSEDPVARYAIWRVNSELTNLLSLITNVHGLRAPNYRGALADMFSEMIVARTSHYISPPGSGVNYGPQLIDSWNPISLGQVIDDLDDLGGKLKKLKVVFDLRKLDLAEHWEKFSENLRTTFQPVYRQFLSEAMGTLFFSLTGKVTSDLLDFIDTIPLIGRELENQQVFHEVVRQAEFGLLKVYQEIEAHVLGKEQRTIEHRELTGLMLGNVIAASTVGLSVGAIGAAIAQIATIQQRLKAVGGSSAVDLDSLRTYLQLP